MFESLGINLEIIVICLLAVILILLTSFIMTIVNTNKLKKIMKNCSTGELDKVIITYYDKIAALSDEFKKGLSRFDIFESNMQLSVQKVAASKYDAFQDNSALSFSVAVLNGHDSGYIVTTLTGRNSTSSYLKIINNGKCEEKLSDEEMQVLTAAKNYHTSKFIK